MGERIRLLEWMRGWLIMTLKGGAEGELVTDDRGARPGAGGNWQVAPAHMTFSGAQVQF